MGQGRHAVVIGAGVAGLTAAYELTRAGWAVSIFEQRDEVGGLARSTHLQGVPIERYYHFICGGDEDLKLLAQELGLGPKLHWRPSRTSYYVNGHLYPFTTPLDILRFGAVSPLARVRFGLHGLRARSFTDWTRIEDLTAEQWLVGGMGREAYETIWRPLLNMKFGAGGGEVSAAWMWHRIWRYATSRKRLLRPEELGYFEGGTLTLLSCLQDRIEQAGGRVHLGQPVRGLVGTPERMSGVATDAGEVEADAVISTVPLPALVPMLPAWAADYARELGGIEFVGVVCLLACLEEPLTSSFWVNVNDARAPFNGFVEYSNLNPWQAAGGSSVLYVPLYLPPSDPRFLLPEKEFAKAMLMGLALLFPRFSPSSVVEWVVTRDSYAQAVCPPGFSRRVPACASPLPGLFITDSTQLYPADRNVSGTIGLARKAVTRVKDGL